MPMVVELCATEGCPKARECAKKLEPDIVSVRSIKFEHVKIYGRFHCIGFQKHYRRTS